MTLRNVAAPAFLACVLCCQSAHVFGRHEQCAASPAEAHHLITSENFNALHATSQQFGGAVSIHAVGRRSLGIFAGACSLFGDGGSFFSGDAQTSFASDFGVGSLTTARYLPAHQQLFAAHAQCSATVTLAAPVGLTPLVLPGEVFDFQAPKALTYKRFDRHNGADAPRASEMETCVSGNADYYDIAPVGAMQVPEGLLEAKWLG